MENKAYENYVLYNHKVSYKFCMYPLYIITVYQCNRSYNYI